MTMLAIAAKSSTLALQNLTLDWRFYLFFYLVIFLYGICIGSFLNVVIYRLPKNESLSKQSSHCMTCGEKIKKRDLVPLFSWLFLRGKCRNCKTKISARYPIVEALNGILYLLAFFFLGIHAQTFVICIFFSLLLVIGFIDWDTMEMDLVLLGLIAVLAVVSAFFPSDLTLVQRLIGTFSISLPFFLIGEISSAIIHKRTGERVRGIELGDTLLMAGGGMLVGTKAAIVGAFVGILLAAVCGVISKMRTSESKLAFGPFLAIGLVVGTLFGDQLVSWYLSFLFAA